ncbi:hypothetical protein [Tateyamaria sp.]|uniref:hypothetical protein n=1 Tax=Tateyamaria sp. TaxID=1929288 RepID=UPI003B21FA48
MGKGDRRAKTKKAPAGCDLPKSRKGSSIRAVPDARTMAGKLASQPDPDPQRVALASRARRAGLADDRDGRKAASVSYMGFPEGLALHSVHGNDTARLWNVWQGYSMAEDAYAYHYMGTRRRASGMKLKAIRDRVEAEDFKRDTRTVDEKARDAVNRWMTWQGYLGRISSQQMATIKAVYWCEGPPLWVQAPGFKPAATMAGVAFVRAIEALADAVDGDRRVK